MQLIRCAAALLILPFVLSSPQSTDPAPSTNSTSGSSCVVNCPAKLDPCTCNENEVCVLVKRTCGQCAKNVCQPNRAAASQSAKTDDKNGTSSQVSFVLIGVCGAGVVALLAGGLFVYQRRRRQQRTNSNEHHTQSTLEVMPSITGKASMESTRDFIHPGAPWVRSANRDRSSVASSVATGWGIPSEAEEGARGTLMLARASTGLFSNPDQDMYKRSFDESNNATDALAELTKQEQLLLPAPAVLSNDSMLDNFKDPAYVEDNMPILPNVPSVDSFARLSFSSSSFPLPKDSPPKKTSPLAYRDSKSMDLRRDPAYRHSATRSIGAMVPMGAPRFPPPRGPPPRVPSTASSIFYDDKDAVNNARLSHGIDLAEYKFPRLPSSSHQVGGTAGNRDSVASVSSVSSNGSIAHVTIARAEPLRARATIIQQKPVVGSLHDMQAERASRMLNGDDSRDRLSAVGSASFHRVAASMGGSSPNTLNHRKSLSTMSTTPEQAYRKLVSQGTSEREKRRSSMVREAMKRASVEFVVRDGSIVRSSNEL